MRWMESIKYSKERTMHDESNIARVGGSREGGRARSESPRSRSHAGCPAREVARAMPPPRPRLGLTVTLDLEAPRPPRRPPGRPPRRRAGAAARRPVGYKRFSGMRTYVQNQM